MSSQLKRRKSSPIRTKKSTLPKNIRDELRMTCTLRGYSSIRYGEGMTKKIQEKRLNAFVHSVEGKNPS